MGLYRRAKSAYWYYKFRYQGQEYAGSTRQTDKREAAKAERAARAKVEARNPRQRVRNEIGLAELGALDIERAIAAKCVHQEIITLRSRWKAICDVLGKNTHPRRVGTNEIDHLAVELARPYSVPGAKPRTKKLKEGETPPPPPPDRIVTRSGQTIAKHLTALKRGLKLAKRRGWILEVVDSDDWPRMRRDPPKEAQRGKLHPEEVVSAWLRGLPRVPRLQATLALLTGLRWGELTRLEASWMQAVDVGEVRVWMLVMPEGATKARKSRTIPLPSAAVAIIQEMAAQADPGGRLFPVRNYKRVYRRALASIGYTKTITLRDLRHMYATHADRLSRDRKATQDVLGHSTEAMTGRYLHSSLERLAAVGDVVGEWAGGLLGTPEPVHPQILQ